MTALRLAAHVSTLAALALVVPGLIVRTKSLWSGRRGAPILQFAWDLRRLVQKTPVYSQTTTVVFRAAPYLALATSFAAAALVPVSGRAPLSFSGDFVLFAYLWGLGRVALMLGALDTGSPFEGMGASREATFSTLLEPALFLLLGALCLAGAEPNLDALLHHRSGWPQGLLLSALTVGALVILVQVESSRMPVDDPTTHLELTMVHEVMILDHSGPDLAALELSSALKLATGLSMIAAALVPVKLSYSPFEGAVLQVASVIALAVGFGTVESLFARLRMRAVPAYIAVAVGLSALALLVGAWRGAP